MYTYFKSMKLNVVPGHSTLDFKKKVCNKKKINTFSLQFLWLQPTKLLDGISGAYPQSGRVYILAVSSLQLHISIQAKITFKKVVKLGLSDLV